jgi:hypothetical protein
MILLFFVLILHDMEKDKKLSLKLVNSIYLKYIFKKLIH